MLVTHFDPVQRFLGTLPRVTCLEMSASPLLQGDSSGDCFRLIQCPPNGHPRGLRYGIKTAHALGLPPRLIQWAEEALLLEDSNHEQPDSLARLSRHLHKQKILLEFADRFHAIHSQSRLSEPTHRELLLGLARELAQALDRKAQ